MSALKKLIRMSGSSRGVVFELRRVISDQKGANAWLVPRYIGLRWIIKMDTFGETSSIFCDFKALGNDSSMFK